LRHYFSFFFAFAVFIAQAQQVTLTGVVKNSSNNPIEGVSVFYSENGTSTSKNGSYILVLPANKTITVTFSHITYKTITTSFTTLNNDTIYFSPILDQKVENIAEVTIKENSKKNQGFITVNPESVTKIPGANEGVENVLMSFAGVNNNNELSTQYNVRGGNYDENLVYVNGIEVYRPFLIRAGQQEGLSFLNPDLVQQIKFSAGGFQAKYGDKMASVLDITYKKPTTFNAKVSGSLLGGSIAVEGTLFKSKLQGILGIRYRNNSLFINSKDIETNSNPNFTDVQTFLSYQINSKLNIDFLGNLSVNNYNFTPTTRRTKFGTITNPLELIVNYSGKEEDSFKTAMGALSASYIHNNFLKINATTSAYHTIEEEFYDILASYNIAEVNNNFGSDDFGEVTFSQGIGSQLNHARNELDALIINSGINATYSKNNTLIDAGIKFQYEDIKNKMSEWEIIDSLGFSVRPPIVPPNYQPYEPFTGELVPFQNISAFNKLNISRLEWYAQYSKNTFLNNHLLFFNAGIRGHNWKVNQTESLNKDKFTFSLRGQLAFKPKWEKDMVFRIAGGMYNQPPTYKELRNFNAQINADVNAQKSLHLILGHDYAFKLWERPFKLESEIYFKKYTNVNIYTLDNVRIRYVADNNAKAFANGVDLRLNGEFVPGTESWISIGFLKTEENYNNEGYRARPTDQRFKFAMLFQDYVPNIPKIKMYLNLVFNSGLPGGSPSYANPNQYQNRLNAYKRADIGIAYVFTDKNFQSNNSWLVNFKELSVGFQIINMFDVQNAITNTWVRDVYTKQFYGIPNYMTQRVFNVKIDARL
jgi:hypothetical protein